MSLVDVQPVQFAPIHELADDRHVRIQPAGRRQVADPPRVAGSIGAAHQRTRPASAASTPAQIRSSVVLPDAGRPASPNSSPGPQARLTSCKRRQRHSAWRSDRPPAPRPSRRPPSSSATDGRADGSEPRNNRLTYVGDRMLSVAHRIGITVRVQPSASPASDLRPGRTRRLPRAVLGHQTDPGAPVQHVGRCPARPRAVPPRPPRRRSPANRRRPARPARRIDLGQRGDPPDSMP